MKKFTLIFFAACLVSCVMLEPRIVPEDSPESASISFSVEWPEGVSPQDTVYVAMNAVNTTDTEEEPVKYGYRLNPKGEFYSGTTEEHIVKFGNYIFLAFTCDDDAVKIDWPSDFISESDIPLKDFSAGLLKLSEEELSPLMPQGAKDFNTDIPYLRQPEAFCFALGKCQVSDTVAHDFTINLTSLVLNLNLRVNILTEEGVTLNEVVGELSGIPSSVSLFAGTVEQKDLGRVIFPMSASSDPDDSTYSASFNILGIFPPESSKLYFGSGILRLRVSASYGEKTKYLYPAINLYDLIVSAGLMSPAQNGRGYKITKEQATLDIPVTLVIGKGSFVSEGDSEGVDSWFDSEETIEVEV